MRKFVSLLSLSAFLVASHMQVVHAWDMFGMGTETGHAEGMGHSIFCTENPTDQSASDCAKETLPKDSALTARSSEVQNPEAEPLPFSKFRTDGRLGPPLAQKVLESKAAPPAPPAKK